MKSRVLSGLFLAGLLSLAALYGVRRHGTRGLLALLPPPPADSLEWSLSAGLARLREEVGRHPRDSRAWGKLGMAWHIHQFHRQALDCYAAAARLDPGAFAWTYYRALALQSLARPEARQALLRADTLRPGFAPLQWRLGQAALSAGEPAEAKARFREAARLEPKAYPALLALAQVLAGQDSLAAADSQVDALINDFPEYREAYALRSDLRRRSGSGDGDSTWLQKPAFGSFPDAYQDSLVDMGMSSFWHLDRAERRLRKAQWDEATREFRMALRIRPDADIFAKLAEILARTGKPVEAERELQRGLAAFPENPTLLNTMGLLFTIRRDAVEAIPWYQRAVAAKPGDPAGHRNLAVAFAAADRFREAQAACAQALGRISGDEGLVKDCGVIDSIAKAALMDPKTSARTAPRKK